MGSEYEPDRNFSREIKAKETPKARLDEDGVEEALPDVISDPGVEGGVDVVNEETEEPETEEPETEA
jgi:hypothetical protein